MNSSDRLCNTTVAVGCEISYNSHLNRRVSSFLFFTSILYIQSTLVTSKSKGPSETLGDIRTSTYQMCSIEETPIEQPNFTNEQVI